MEKDDETGIVVPGFLAGGIPSGIKANNEKDIALIYSEIPAVTAAVFTQNRVKAAPILVSMERVKAQVCQAVIVNSGNANACTGRAGLDDAYTMSKLAALDLNIDESLVLVASTGVIGRRLPMERIYRGIPRLTESLTPYGITSAAEAIMTTDTYPKVVLRKGSINGKEVTVCGIVKGSGMIMPNMATMLSFILTDADIEIESLEEVFREGIKYSFNSISVDGETSTNDMAVILANGMAGNPTISLGSEGLGLFKNLLMEVLVELSRMIVKDGEGATKFVEIRVVNAERKDDAERVAFSVANSNLVKTAFFGEDCNWGRIVSATGASGAKLDPDKVNVSFDDIMVVKNGMGMGDDIEEKANKVLQKGEFRIIIDLNCGSKETRVFTTDLSPEYIKINADYRS